MASIDRINGLGPLESKTIANSRKVQDTSEAGTFELQGDEYEGVLYEPSSASRPQPKTMSQVKEEIAREERAAAISNLHSRFDGPGVAVELSKPAMAAGTSAAGQTSILDIIKGAWQSVRNWLHAVWTGEKVPVNDDETVTTGALEITADASEMKSDAGDETLTHMELDNSPETITSFMTDYGGRHLAKNSDLLTQYDRTGHITSPSASDRRRILQGEGHVQKF